MSGFSFRKNLAGVADAFSTIDIIGYNSIVFQVGDLVRVNTSGFASLVTTGDSSVGVVVGVTDVNGGVVSPDSNTLDVYTMASDNTTVARKKIKVIPAYPNYLFFNDADGSLAQANLLQFVDTNDENDVKTSTLTDTWSAQLQLIELDPDGDADASKGLFRIVESQIGAQISDSLEAA